MTTHPERPSAGRDEILSAAARAFAERGYHGMSMRDLAKATNRSPATLYNYVDSKEDLLYLIQKNAFEELLAAGRAAVAGTEDATERLHRFVQSHVQFFGNRQYLMRVLIHEAAALPAGRRAEVRERKEAYFQLAQDIVRDLGRARTGSDPSSADVERNTYCLFGMLNWTYGWYEPERHGSPEELALGIERVALTGIAPSAPTRPRRDSDLRLDRQAAPLGAESEGAR